MSNLWVNIRIFAWHFQIPIDSWKPRLSYNDYWRGFRRPYIEIYDFPFWRRE